jgi:aspartyl/asparaginyl beta-hydroxylase (cupin superfamily)
MTEISPVENLSFGQRFKKARRRVVKRSGKNLIRGLATFLGKQSKVGDTPVYDSALFPFLKDFTENWQQINAEVKDILKFREEIPVFHDVSPDQMRISTGTNWRTFILFGFGQKLEKNAKHAPFTTALLEKVPQLQTAWFSILGPNYHIPPHRGVTKGILRAHLGLIIPRDSKNCYLRVADQIKVWHPGEIFVFDDTYEHEVYNNTDDERVILLFDFDRPMKFWGRALNNSFLQLMKLTAYYQEPKKNLASFEDRFEAATRRNNENYEKLSDH